MELKHSGHGKNELPPEKELTELLDACIKKAGLNSSLVTVEIQGSDHRYLFPKHGIKLVRPNPFATDIIIGGTKCNAKARVSLKTPDRQQTVAGINLFNLLNNACEKRIFDFVLNEERARKSNGKNGTPAPSTETKQPEAGQKSDPATDIVPLPSAPGPEQQADADPAKFFGKPEHFQNVMVSLMLVVNEDCEVPFGMSQFEKALHDASVPEEAGICLSVLRMLTLRGLVERINPGNNPARYRITEIGAALAKGPVPKELPPIVNSASNGKQPRPTGTKVPESAPAVTVPMPTSEISAIQITEARARELKRIFEEANAIEATIAEDEGRLRKLESVDLNKEESELQSRIASLEKSLADAKRAVANIDERRKHMGVLKSRIQANRATLENPTTKQALAEFELLRRIFVT